MELDTTATTVRAAPENEAWREAVQRLHTGLKQAEYHRCQWIPTHNRWIAAPLEPINFWHFVTHRRRRLMEPTAIPGLYRRLQRIRHPLIEELLGFFGLGEAQHQNEVTRLLNQLDQAPTYGQLIELGIVRQNPDGRVECRLRFIPHGHLILVSDRHDRSISDFTYVGRDSLKLADLLSQSLNGRAFRSGLDICCGCGIQALTIARSAQTVIGVDINPRSVVFSEQNASLNGYQDQLRFIQGDLTEPLEGPFDVVVANPPFVFMPTEMAVTNRDGFGGDWGLEFVRRIIADLDRLLAPDGEAYLLSASPVVEGQSLLEQLIDHELQSTKLGAHLHALHYRLDPQLGLYQRQHGMRYEIGYYVRISRKLPRGVRRTGLPPWSRMANRLYVELSHLAHR